MTKIVCQIKEIIFGKFILSSFTGANDIVIHCDGIDGEEQKLLFEGILQHSVELFTLKRNTMLLTCQTAEGRCSTPNRFCQMFFEIFCKF